MCERTQTQAHALKGLLHLQSENQRVTLAFLSSKTSTSKETRFFFDIGHVINF